MRRRMLIALVTLGGVVALALASVGQAVPAAKTIKGTVGPGFTIAVTPKTIKAGRHSFVIQDKSGIHNWHITGPGVNKVIGGVSQTGTFRATLTLRKGTYTIVCDPHASTMKTTLKVT